MLLFLIISSGKLPPSITNWLHNFVMLLSRCGNFLLNLQRKNEQTKCKHVFISVFSSLLLSLPMQNLFCHRNRQRLQFRTSTQQPNPDGTSSNIIRRIITRTKAKMRLDRIKFSARTMRMHKAKVKCDFVFVKWKSFPSYRARREKKISSLKLKWIIMIFSLFAS